MDDPETVKSKLSLLNPEEQFYYKQGEEFIKQNPPIIIPPNNNNNSNDISTTDSNAEDDPIMNHQTKQFIEEEGASAWEFQADPNLPNDTILIENKTEITFLNYNYDASVMTNLPIPCINRVYYCEFKIFELNNSPEQTNLSPNEVISMGLATSPYPYFRLPGRHHHSIAYDSNGARRFNDSFPLDPELANLFPVCERGDIIGVGYRTRSGTFFFTRNGKKVSEKSIGGHIKGCKIKYLYPIVGTNVPCKVHVNFGTYGFVYIEANVKKWGYAKSHGLKVPPPSYEEYGKDALVGSYQDLEDGINDEEEDYEDEEEEDEEEDYDEEDDNTTTETDPLRDEYGQLLPPPPGFEFSTSPLSNFGQNEEEDINLNSLPYDPPRYSQDVSNRTNSFTLDEGRSKDFIENDASWDEHDDEADYERTTNQLQGLLEDHEEEEEEEESDREGVSNEHDALMGRID